jgi:hypothetical protein
MAAGACTGGRPRGGDEVDPGQNWYGWVTSYDVGHRYTEGLAVIEVTRSAEGPIQLLSAKPVMVGDENVELLGVHARLFGCGLWDETWRGFDVLDGFPPSDPIGGGAVPMEGFEVPAPADSPYGERCGGYPNRLQVNLLFGYEVVGEGKSWRRGTEIVYKYQGKIWSVFIQNRMTVCSPAGVECEFVGPSEE